MLNSDRGCYVMGGAHLPLSLNSGNVLWTVETAGVDCAETEVAGLFTEFREDSTWPLNFKAKYPLFEMSAGWEKNHPPIRSALLRPENLLRPPERDLNRLIDDTAAD